MAASFFHGERMEFHFSDDGFLSIGPLTTIAEIQEKYSIYLITATKVNRVAQRFQYTLKPNKGSLHELLAVSYYAHILSTYQACVMLMCKGMKFQVEMLLRCMLDYQYPLIAISEEPGFVDELVASDPHNKLSKLNKLERYYTRGKKNRRMAKKMKKSAEKLKEDLEKVRELKSAEIARRAGYEDDYDTLYSFLSDTVHPSIATLEKLFIIDGEEIKEMINEPIVVGTNDLFHIAINILFNSVKAIEKIFSLEKNVELEELVSRMNRLMLETQDEAL